MSLDNFLGVKVKPQDYVFARDCADAFPEVMAYVAVRAQQVLSLAGPIPSISPEVYSKVDDLLTEKWDEFSEFIRTHPNGMTDALNRLCDEVAEEGYDESDSVVLCYRMYCCVQVQKYVDKAKQISPSQLSGDEQEHVLLSMVHWDEPFRQEPLACVLYGSMHGANHLEQTPIIPAFATETTSLAEVPYAREDIQDDIEHIVLGQRNGGTVSGAELASQNDQLRYGMDLLQPEEKPTDVVGKPILEGKKEDEVLDGGYMVIDDLEKFS